jgi:hypothetical protein
MTIILATYAHSLAPQFLRVHSRKLIKPERPTVMGAPESDVAASGRKCICLLLLSRCCVLDMQVGTYGILILCAANKSRLTCVQNVCV